MRPKGVNPKYEDEIKANKERLDFLLNQADFLDDDGYPTEDALEIIEKWHWDDAKGWFDFIKGIWHLRSWGWNEVTEKHEWYEDETVQKYYISTAGWSGNESIIRSMQKNDMMWFLNWYQSNRGGHYVFELKEFNDE
jgi:hypothetical protein